MIAHNAPWRLLMLNRRHVLAKDLMTCRHSMSLLSRVCCPDLGWRLGCVVIRQRVRCVDHLKSDEAERRGKSK